MFSERVQLIGVMVRQRAREETKRKVMAAAQALFDERGYADATVRDIARRAGVSVGTVMSVGDKEALLVQMFDGLIEAEHVNRGVVARDEAASPPSFTPSEETPGTLRQCVAVAVDLVRPFLRLFAGRLDLARTYGSALLSGRHSSAVFAALGERLIEEFEAAIAPCCGAHARKKAEAMHAAYIGTLFIWGAGGADDLEVRLADVFLTICHEEQS